MDKEKQEFLKNWLTTLTFTGEPFSIDEGISVKQRTIREVLQDKTYNMCIFPFIITTDYFIKKDASIRNTLEGFFKIDEESGKFVFEEAGVPLLSYLMAGIKYFFNAEEVNITSEKVLVVDKKFSITKDNFDEIAEIIAKLNGRERIKELEPPAHLSDAQREVWVKTMQGRKKKAEKEALSLIDIINIVTHFDNGIRYKETLDLTILQLYNSFNVLMKKDRFDKYYKLYSSGQFEIKTHEEHWVNTVKKNYKEKEE